MRLIINKLDSDSFLKAFHKYIYVISFKQFVLMCCFYGFVQVAHNRALLSLVHPTEFLDQVLLQKAYHLTFS